MSLLVSVLTCLLLSAAPASLATAGNAFQPGTGLQLGGVYFHVVSASTEGALFRVTDRLTAEGVEEHRDCYRVGRAFYHQEACPVLQEFFARHGEAAGTPAPAAQQSGAAYAQAGSHPIDYLRGTYVEADEGDYWVDGLFFHPWYGTSFVTSSFDHRSRSGGARPGRGFARGRGGRSFASVSVRRW